MSLEAYRRKRDFARTPEPAPEAGASKAAGTPLRYVIQKHAASRLHWDLRLEEDGVLKSWAIPKEPPSEKGVKRLAVEVEDHTLAYADFEGTIPEDAYGAGIVEIWDTGTYLPIDTKPGARIFEIRGRRLSGPYALIKIKGKKPGEKPWLFFKK
jgi:DNA ligase D-like protein (predicted 3'-phosphoesterase)